MSSKSKLAAMMGIFGLMSVMRHGNHPKELLNSLGKGSNEPESEIEKAIRLGLKYWRFGDNVVYAATKKKAMKIALKNGWL